MVRLLFCGDLTPDVNVALPRLQSLIKKSGPFSFLLLAHPPPPPSAPFPVPTYFAAQDYDSSPHPRQLGPNLHYVGPTATLHLHSLVITLVAAGYDDPPDAATVPLPPEVERAVTSAGARGAGFHGVDVLVSPPPRGPHVRIPGKVIPSVLSARVGALLRPRYHVCAAEEYAALESFVVPMATHGTRVVAVAPGGAGRKKGARWVYAADVAELRGMSEAERKATARGAGMLGYEVEEEGGVRKREREWRDRLEETEERDVRWAQGVKGGRESAVGRKGAKRPRVELDVDAACWFCLATGKDAHLVVAVGERTYVTVAKGGLNDGHVLIIPVAHVAGSAHAVAEEELRTEVKRMQEGVRRYFERFKNGSGAYFFERCVKTRGGEKQMHTFVEAVPVRKEAIVNGEAVCKEIGERFGMELEWSDGACGVDVARKNVRKARGTGVTEYFWAELPDGKTVLQVWEASKTDGSEERKVNEGAEREKERRGRVVRLGRLVAATLLGVPHRSDWKRCVASKEKEEAIADRVRRQLGRCLREVDVESGLV